MKVCINIWINFVISGEITGVWIEWNITLNCAYKLLKYMLKW